MVVAILAEVVQVQVLMTQVMTMQEEIRTGDQMEEPPAAQAAEAVAEVGIDNFDL
jgi:hypothetical protein